MNETMSWDVELSLTDETEFFFVKNKLQIKMVMRNLEDIERKTPERR